MHTNNKIDQKRQHKILARLLNGDLQTLKGEKFQAEKYEGEKCSKYEVFSIMRGERHIVSFTPGYNRSNPIVGVDFYGTHCKFYDMSNDMMVLVASLYGKLSEPDSTSLEIQTDQGPVVYPVFGTFEWMDSARNLLEVYEHKKVTQTGPYRTSIRRSRFIMLQNNKSGLPRLDIRSDTPVHEAITHVVKVMKRQARRLRGAANPLTRVLLMIDDTASNARNRHSFPMRTALNPQISQYSYDTVDVMAIISHPDFMMVQNLLKREPMNVRGTTDIMTDIMSILLEDYKRVTCMGNKEHKEATQKILETVFSEALKVNGVHYTADFYWATLRQVHEILELERRISLVMSPQKRQNVSALASSLNTMRGSAKIWLSKKS